MTETRRRLTTIFCADVQDYTRLMGADEEGTLATLKRYRDAMGRLITSHEGRVVNTWGDGLIAEFPSVVEAVRAAIDVQNELAGLNAGRTADGRMLFRIGINLGDVIVEGADIYGDGVNIAARLQGCAPAGGIVISNTVYDQVRNKVAVGFDFLGPLTVKNVEEAVPSYAVRIGEAESRSSPAPDRNERGPRPAPVAASSRSMVPKGRRIGLLGLVAIGLVALNLLTWDGEFWAAWPILVMMLVVALVRVRRQTSFDRFPAMLAVIGLFLVAVNLLSWHGIFWAVYPLLGLALAAAARYLTRRR